jgi:hypothetical protein
MKIYKITEASEYLGRKYQPAMRRNAKKRPAAKPPPLALGWLLTVNRQSDPFPQTFKQFGVEFFFQQTDLGRDV